MLHAAYIAALFVATQAVDVTEVTGTTCVGSEDCGDEQYCQINYDDVGYCADSCQFQNATYCARTQWSSDMRCQDDGSCDYDYCDFGDSDANDQCADGDICGSGGVCTAQCSSDDDCGTYDVCDDSGECVYRGCSTADDCEENYTCDTSTFNYYYCTESCTSPNATACDEYDNSEYCDEDSGLCVQDTCTDSTDCTNRDGYDTCDWGTCVMGCGNFNASYCSIKYGSDTRCQADGTCDINYCDYYDGGDDDCDGLSDTDDLVCSPYGSCVVSCVGQDDNFCYDLTYDSDAVCQDSGNCERNYCYSSDDCPDGTACSEDDYCVTTCEEDSECEDLYSNDNYKCDADTGTCAYRECLEDDDCSDDKYCNTESPSWYCEDSCDADNCDDYCGPDFGCECLDNGRYECTYLGCNADGSSCDDNGFETVCQDDGECGYPDDDCAEDADCDGDQVCHYLPNWDEDADAMERRFCGDSCVGRDETYCQGNFDYENCDADTGTCYECRSDADCTNEERPTCYVGTNGNGCYLGCSDDSDCSGYEQCLYSEEAQTYYCGETGEDSDQTPRPTMDTTAEPTAAPVAEAEDPVNNSGAVQQRVVMTAVAMVGLAWWM